jgi:PAS domain S-box-containing protein
MDTYQILAHDFPKKGSWSLFINTNELQWSNYIYQVFDLDVAEKVTLDLYKEHVHPEDIKKVKKAFNQCSILKKPFEMEHRIISRSGKIKWVGNKCTIISNKQGEPVKVLGVIRDITGIKLGEEELVVHNNPNQRENGLIYPQDFSYNYYYLSTSLKPFNKPSFLSQPKSEKESYLNKEQEPEGIHAITPVKTINKDQKVYIDSLKQSNELMMVTLNELKEKNKKNKLTNLKLKKSKEQLRNKYNQIKIKNNALDQMAIIVEADSEGKILDVNKQFEKLTGYTKKEVTGINDCLIWNNIFNSGLYDKDFYNNIGNILKKGLSWEGEICIKSKSGKLIYLIKKVIPFYDKDQNIIKFYSVSDDITNSKSRELQLLEAKISAEKALFIKDEFLSVMSHEIRTPLNSVIGLSSLLIKKNPREDQQKILLVLQNSACSLLSLINNILDLKKIEAGKIELENIDFNLKEYLNDLHSTFLPLAIEKDIDFQIYVEPNIPDFITGDVARLNQILVNLINNAIKFTLKGSVILNIRSSKKEKLKTIITFEVEDTGIGMDEAKLNEAFTPFNQIKKETSRIFGGTGLGLYVVKGLVDLFEGNINIKSNKNAGSVFTVELPFLVSERSNTLTLERKKSPKKLPDLEGYHVLYVEDIESNRFMIHSIFENYKIKCSTVTNGKEALEVCKQIEFDAILMDLKMPDMDGYEVTSCIQKEGKNINTPIIAFTAEAFTEKLKKKVIQMGMKSVLNKPFKIESLLKKLALQIKSKHLL